MSGVPSWVRLGAKVVAIGRALKPGEPTVINDQGFRWKPTVGEVYTIRGWWEDSDWGCFILLAEEPANHGFHVEGFRPVKTIEDDIKAHFQALLDVRAPQLEDAT